MSLLGSCAAAGVSVAGSVIAVTERGVGGVREPQEDNKGCHA